MTKRCFNYIVKLTKPIIDHVDNNHVPPVNSDIHVSDIFRRRVTVIRYINVSYIKFMLSDFREIVFISVLPLSRVMISDMIYGSMRPS